MCSAPAGIRGSSPVLGPARRGSRRVLKVVEKGDTADLTVSGKQDGKAQNGVVHMAKEGGAWKVQREEWKD